MNRHTVIGNLTRDPEFKAIGVDTLILKFSVAVNSSYKDKRTGEWVKKTEYINCQCWGPQADRLSRILSRGTKVFVEGPSETREFENKQGSKVKYTTLNAQTVIPFEQKQTMEVGQAESFEPSPSFNDDVLPF